jgi:myo-inositol-1(or 4)-monophosphatase
LDSKPISVAEPEEYSQSLISVDISKGSNLNRARFLLEKSQHLRSLGCTAVSLCQIASGAIDAHIDLRGIVRATDVSAGLIILQEAGGEYIVNGAPGGDFALTRDTRMKLIAANSAKLLDEINSMTGHP